MPKKSAKSPKTPKNRFSLRKHTFPSPSSEATHPPVPSPTALKLCSTFHVMKTPIVESNARPHPLRVYMHEQAMAQLSLVASDFIELKECIGLVWPLNSLPVDCKKNGMD
jgi:hypothetical protein